MDIAMLEDEIDVTTMALELGRSGYQATFIDKKIIDAIEKENKKREKFKIFKTILCEIRETGLINEGAMVKELIQNFYEKGKVVNSRTLGFFTTESQKQLYNI
jgi:anaerobic ribonucleoside-triphosphate reductase